LYFVGWNLVYSIALPTQLAQVCWTGLTLITSSFLLE